MKNKGKVYKATKLWSVPLGQRHNPGIKPLSPALQIFYHLGHQGSPKMFIKNARSWGALGEARPGQSSLSAGALRYRAWAQSWSSAALPRGQRSASWRRWPPGWAAATVSRKGSCQGLLTPVSAHTDRSFLHQTPWQHHFHLLQLPPTCPETLTTFCGSQGLRCPVSRPGT